MIELTPNQKAATFIGWKPGDWCKSGLEFCSIHGPSGTHGNAAPDMTSPANYMRALEGLVAVKEEYRDRTRLIKFRHQPWVRGANWAVEVELIELTVEGGWALSAGEAAMLLLARLYDQEHRNG